MGATAAVEMQSPIAPDRPAINRGAAASSIDSLAILQLSSFVLRSPRACPVHSERTPCIPTGELTDLYSYYNHRSS
jgi:hypothetical protein